MGPPCGAEGKGSIFGECHPQASTEAAATSSSSVSSPQAVPLKSVVAVGGMGEAQNISLAIWQYSTCSRLKVYVVCLCPFLLGPWVAAALRYISLLLSYYPLGIFLPQIGFKWVSRKTVSQIRKILKPGAKDGMMSCGRRSGGKGPYGCDPR